MNQPDFVVKCYNKQDLAQMYFPDITVRASVNKLRRWMRRCQPLMDEILSTDFHPKTKAFSVREVRLITYYLLFNSMNFFSVANARPLSSDSLARAMHSSIVFSGRTT